MAETVIAPLLAQALRAFDASLAMRGETEEDFAFLCELFADVRREEFAPVPWPEQAKREFLDAQCKLQRDHYARHYAGAELLLIVQGETPLGRLYVHATKAEIRVMEIALLRELRGRGIGSLLIRGVQQEAARRGVEVTLHVEPHNPAQRMYRRLGFELVENRGVYDFLKWSPAAEATATGQLNTASN
ncbi:MAG TPA: GNAT family N-acetyltransferase [Dokdonella sp.]|jgi:ribosomal protein S18 acetylase RimI-like enzyme|nr:GNAT family N-acetyltransferase [Dokdonella sp.]